MSESFKSPPASPSTWSTRIAERYRCHLSPVLADWFDSGLWKLAGRSEYREPISPEELLAPAPEAIWPGLMSCDLLPLVGNTAGDWLCARIGQDNQMSQIVQWYHGGGDWIPWGDDLAEAFVFDAVIDRITSQEFRGTGLPRQQVQQERRRHAIPAENPRPDFDPSRRLEDPLLRWALGHVAPSVADAVDRDTSGDELVAAMLESQVAEIAVRCELVVALLTPWPRETLNNLFRSLPDLDRSLLARWSFDLDHMPRNLRDRLHQQTGVAGYQDWEAASQHAQSVCQISPNLAWGWEIAGYGAERAGDIQFAQKAYHRGSRCSVFTDQSVRLDTHWLSCESAKFSVARMHRLDVDEVEQSTYLRLLCQPEMSQRRREATIYWSDKAAQWLEQDSPSEAYRCFMAAAWDLGAEPISSYTDLLDRVAESAELAGQASRAEIARTHRKCLHERYGV